MKQNFRDVKLNTNFWIKHELNEAEVPFINDWRIYPCVSEGRKQHAVPSEEHAHIFLIKYHLGGIVVKEGNAKYRMGGRASERNVKHMHFL